MSLRTAAINFVAAENVTDREELLFRAHRHASNLTGQLPVPTAQRAVQSFVAAVNREFSAARRAENSDPEPDRHVDHDSKVDRIVADNEDEELTRWGSRTATVTDFPDELMY